MAAQTIVDLDGLDLTQCVFSHEEMYEVLHHTGRFALLDDVVYFQEEEEFIVGRKEIRSDDWWAEDHIPGRPLFPGVLMVEACAQLGSFDFSTRHPQYADRFIGFVRIGKTRFRNVVEPDCTLFFVVKVIRFRGMMFTYECQGIVNGEVVFDGEVTGMAM